MTCNDTFLDCYWLKPAIKCQRKNPHGISMDTHTHTHRLWRLRGVCCGGFQIKALSSEPQSTRVVSHRDLYFLPEYSNNLTLWQ